MDLALWESRRIWPQIERPDVVISLGTGTEQSLGVPEAPNARHLLQDGFIPRLYRSFLSSLDGERIWQEFVNGLEEIARRSYFRLNVTLPTRSLAIDDTRCMDDLRDAVYISPTLDNDIESAATALLVSMFYFQLSSIPTDYRRMSLCVGFIKCRMQGPAVVESLYKLHQTSSMVFTADCHQRLGEIGNENFCNGCGFYSQGVSFHVKHPSENLCLYLEIDHKPIKISGFPQNMQWFVDQQHLDSTFGSDCHKIVNDDAGCRCNATVVRRKKRKRSNGAY